MRTNEGSHTSQKVFRLINNQKNANCEEIRNHFTPTSLTKMKKGDFSKCWYGGRAVRTLFHTTGWHVNWSNHLGE